MKQKTSIKRKVKVGILALMGIGFLLLSPQLTVGMEGIIFAVVWAVMATLGAVSLYHEWKAARRSAREKAVYAFKKNPRFFISSKMISVSVEAGELSAWTSSAPTIRPMPRISPMIGYFF